MKRIGRGNSSKKGNTSGRGNKGQKSRSGFSKKKFFLGGQTPINILYPKYGFKKKKKNKISNKKIEKNIIIGNFEKFLKNNKFKKIFLKNFFCSKNAKKKIINFGGYVEKKR
ncbi:50S ribosomal protein L15 [Candidatus Vidania fulgoroideorum]